MLGELGVERRAEHPGLDPRRARDPVDLEHPVERAEVDADRARVVVADPRLDPAADAGAAPERDRGGALVGAPGEHRLDLGLVAGAGDEVGGVVDPTAKAADDVAIRLAERVHDPLAAIVADDLRQRAGRAQPRGPQLDLLDRDGQLGRRPEAEPLARRRRGDREPLGVRLLVGEPPAPVLARAALGGYQCTPRIRFANRTCWLLACSSVVCSGCAPGSFFLSPLAALESGNRW